MQAILNPRCLLRHLRCLENKAREVSVVFEDLFDRFTNFNNNNDDDDI